MKNWKMLVMLFVVGGFIVACGDDDTVEDTTNPTITAAVDTSIYAPGDTVMFSIEARDNVALDSVGYSNPNLGSRTFAAGDTVYLLDLDLILDVSTPDGRYPFTITAKDEAGNSASTSVDVNVLQ